jgi:hypothetical protein
LIPFASLLLRCVTTNLAVVADENLLECTPGNADAPLQRIQSKTPIFLDMDCIRAERISKFVTWVARRRGLEYKAAREPASAELQSELKSEVTGLLITSELALKAPSVSAQLIEKLVAGLESAKRMRAKLEK